MLWTQLCIALFLLLTLTSAFFPLLSDNLHAREIKGQMVNMMFSRAKVGGIIITVDGKTIVSEEKTVNLRKELMKNNIDVYTLKSKITGNCGGAGVCGTCAVKVLEGGNNLSPPSKNELNTLKITNKANDLRLSCCARVVGPVVIKTKP
jgi:ferredoxin